jgi:stringent starvation protein B
MEKQGMDKKDQLLSALEQGMVMIHLDARRPGVSVPHQLRQEAHLRLNLSYRFDPPDLSVTEWGIRSTLSFSGSRFTIAVPWSSLFALTSYVTKEFWLYPEDMPPELVEQTMAQANAPAGSEEGKDPNAPISRATLQGLSGDKKGDSDSEPDPETEDGGAKRKPRSHLRLVK